MLRTSRRDIIGISLIIIVSVSAFLVFKSIQAGSFDGLRSNFGNDWHDLLTQLKILQENSLDFFSPPRKKPYSFLVAQERLRLNIPQVFENFAERDWEDFWNLIYGLYETDDYPSDYSLKRKRQLSIEEIEKILIRDYPNFFGRFDERIWKDFWALVFKD